MLKLRLKRGGRKRRPAYRIILIKSSARREGRPVENLGFYNPISNELVINSQRIKSRLKQGAVPTKTVKNLLLRAGL